MNTMHLCVVGGERERKGENACECASMRGVMGKVCVLKVVFRKRAQQFVALLWKETCNLRHPMGLCHHKGKKKGKKGVTTAKANADALQTARGIV